MQQSMLSNIRTIYIREKLSCEELLVKMGTFAVEQQLAKEGYVNALLEREAEFATGLHASVDIAIPHADSIWTNQAAMIVAFLDEPVEFRPMGGQGGSVAVKIVFMLVIPDNKFHIEFLRAISGYISDGDHLPELYETKDISCLVNYLKEQMQENEIC